MSRRSIPIPLALIAAVLVAWVGWPTQPTSAQSGAKNGEWRYYGADVGSTKYTPLDQINASNFSSLRVAWRWKSENNGNRPEYNWQATPLMIGGVLYTTAGTRRDVVAIDGATGETLWLYRYDEGRRGELGPRQNARGVAYWSDGRGDDRILFITQGFHLIALSAKTGRPVPTFGKDGIVDLYDDFDQPKPADGTIGSSSPPLVVRDVVVVGAALVGGTAPPTKANTKGYIRGFDVRTGKRNWIFHTIPTPGEVGNETWEKDSWSYTGNVAAWAPLSGDEELGYVYIPVETPTSDYYGGDRPGNNLFADSLVCLDATTGKRVWHFQLVHHGIWDYDSVAPPVVYDATVNGQRVKAVAQITKQAFVYAFNRVTGQPIWPIPEVPVPQSDVPGEKTSPTQPIPTKPAAFDVQGVTENDLIDFTPELKAEALKIMKDYKIGPLYTPPVLANTNGFKGRLHLPSQSGGANWEGGAVDPETGVLYVSSNTSLAPTAMIHDDRSEFAYVQAGTVDNPSPRVGAPPGTPVFFGPQGLPMAKPPYGRITAIDMNSGDHLWMVANGETPEYIKNHPALKGLTFPKTGQGERVGLMVTKSLLIAGEGSGLFAVPAGSGGPMLYAYDKKTGAVVGQYKMPANQSGIPMSYMINGKQYITLAIGARGVPGELISLTLP